MIYPTLLLLAASASGSSSVTKIEDSCGAEKAMMFIGRKATPAVRSQIEQIAADRPVRWIKPNQPITMDWSISRMNIELDRNDLIKTIHCG